MTDDQRNQPWRAFWSPDQSRPAAERSIPELPVDQGKTVIIADSGGFTPQKYSQLYKADAPANATRVNQNVQIEQDAAGKHLVELK